MRRPARTSAVLLTALLATVAGCASAGGAAGSRGSPNVITRDQLEPLANLSAYDAVRRLRPTWLQVRGNAAQPPVVILDGSPMGGPDALRTIQADAVVRMVYVNGRDATTRYGTGYGGGAIQVTTR